MKSLLLTLLTGATIGSSIPVSSFTHSSNQIINNKTDQNSDYQFYKTFTGSFKLSGVGVHELAGFSQTINEIWNFINDKKTDIGDFSVTNWTGCLTNLAVPEPVASINMLNSLLTSGKTPVIIQTQSNIENFDSNSYLMSLLSWVEINGAPTVMNINAYSESQLFNDKEIYGEYTYTITVGYNQAKPQLISSVIGTQEITLIPKINLQAPQDLLKQATSVAEKYHDFKITHLDMVLTDKNGKKYVFKLEQELINLLNLKILENSNFNEKDSIKGALVGVRGTVFTLNYSLNGRLETMEIGVIPVWAVPYGQFVFSLIATLNRN